MFFTFTGNDASCAAAVTVLDIVEREGLVERAATVGASLGAKLRDAFAEHPAVADVRGRGMFYGIELRCRRDAVVAAALARDLWVYPAGSGPVPEAVMVAPPFVITEAECDELVDRLAGALAAARLTGRLTSGRPAMLRAWTTSSWWAASLAGLRACEQLRTSGFTGRITLVGAEAHEPYDRPPLSKKLLAGDWDADRIRLRKPGELDELRRRTPGSACGRERSIRRARSSSSTTAARSPTTA